MHILLSRHAPRKQLLMSTTPEANGKTPDADPTVTANLDANTKRWITVLGAGGPGAIILAIAAFVYQMDGRVAHNEVRVGANEAGIKRVEMANSAVLAKIDVAIDKLENVVRLDERVKALEARMQRLEGRP